MSAAVLTWRQRLGLGDAYPLHAPTDVERAMVAEIAELRAQADAGPLVAAVRLLAKAKGRYHTEQNYGALVAALNAYDRGACRAASTLPERWISVDQQLLAKGQQVVAYRPTAAQTNDDPVRLVRYTGGERESWQGVTHGFDCICHPTHWMPLPAAPSHLSGAKAREASNG